METTETMGDRVRTLRVARGLSLAGLGKLVGVGAPAVFQWETGGTQNMKNATFILLCDALGTDPQYLLWGADRKPTPRTSENPPRDPGTTGRMRALKFRG
jgi:transcriptional regulator with XRE-family HTH domain